MNTVERARTPICFEIGPHDTDDMPRWCVLREGHPGEHEFVRIDKIEVVATEQLKR